MLVEHWFIGGPTFLTLVQHSNNALPMFHVCWILGSHIYIIYTLHNRRVVHMLYV